MDGSGAGIRYCARVEGYEEEGKKDRVRRYGAFISEASSKFTKMVRSVAEPGHFGWSRIRFEGPA